MPPDKTAGAGHEHAYLHAPPFFSERIAEDPPGSTPRLSETSRESDPRAENDKGLRIAKSRSGKLEKAFISIAVKLADASDRCPFCAHIWSIRATGATDEPVSLLCSR